MSQLRRRRIKKIPAPTSATDDKKVEAPKGNARPKPTDVEMKLFLQMQKALHHSVNPTVAKLEAVATQAADEIFSLDDKYLRTSFLRSCTRSAVWRASESYLDFVEFSRDLEGTKPKDWEVEKMNRLISQFESAERLFNWFMVNFRISPVSIKELITAQLAKLKSEDPEREAEEQLETLGSEKLQKRILRKITRNLTSITGTPPTAEEVDRVLQRTMARYKSGFENQAESRKLTIDSALDELGVQWDKVMKPYLESTPDLYRPANYGFMSPSYFAMVAAKAVETVDYRLTKLDTILMGLDPKWRSLSDTKTAEFEAEEQRLEFFLKKTIQPLGDKATALVEEARAMGPKARLDDNDIDRGFGTGESREVTF